MTKGCMNALLPFQGVAAHTVRTPLSTRFVGCATKSRQARQNIHYLVNLFEMYEYILVCMFVVSILMVTFVESIHF